MLAVIKCCGCGENVALEAGARGDGACGTCGSTGFALVASQERAR